MFCSENIRNENMLVEGYALVVFPRGNRYIGIVRRDFGEIIFFLQEKKHWPRMTIYLHDTTRPLIGPNDRIAMIGNLK
jgi:hypothetical protein